MPPITCINAPTSSYLPLINNSPHRALTLLHPRLCIQTLWPISGAPHIFHPNSRPESPEWPGVKPRECVCTSHQIAWILGICRAQCLTAHIFNVLLGLRAVKKLDKWIARITHLGFGFGCHCFVCTRTVESCPMRQEWLSLPSQSSHHKSCVVLYPGCLKCISQSTLLSGMVKARRDLGNGLPQVPTLCGSEN